MGFVSIYFKNKDGLKLAAKLTKPKGKTTACVILCHGATVDKEEKGSFTELAARLTKEGFATFRFDFRGHGESEGDSVDMTVTGQINDLESVLEFLLRKGYKRFGVVSASFSGGAASMFVASHQDRIKALIYWNSVLDYRYLLKRWLSEDGKDLAKTGVIRRGNTRYGKGLIDELSKLDLDSKLRKLKIPILFIQGEKDSRIPYRDQEKLANKLHADIEIIRGSEHGFHTKKHLKQAAEAASSFFVEKLTV
jgi:pimeloyl-ACP methyl ester carboxylesterase